MHSYGSSLLEWFFGLHEWMWACFPWLVCIKSRHVMFWISSDRLQPHLLWWLSRAGDLCSALNCRVLCTAAVVPNSTWIQQHCFYVHCLSAIQWLFFLQKKQTKNIQPPTCLLYHIGAAVGFFCINCQFNLTFWWISRPTDNSSVSFFCFL